MSSTTVIQLLSTGPDDTITPASSTVAVGQPRPHLSAEHILAEENVAEHEFPDLSTSRCVIIISILTAIAAMTSMSTGILTVGLPVIADDIGLSGSLLLWPASIFALTSGCSLLLAGAVADVLGNRKIYLTGCVLLMAFVIACGLARTGTELIAFRALQGIAMSLCLPTAVSILTESFPTGKTRNVGFSFLGAGQVLGFSIGLVLGGLLIESVGWRVGYYVCGGVHFVALAIACSVLPEDRKREAITWQRLWKDIDWIGAGIASSCLGMLSYVLAYAPFPRCGIDSETDVHSIVTGSSSSIREPLNASLTTLAAVLVPVFVGWVSRQERLGKPALIPNSLWKIPAFTAVCSMVLISWGVMNSMEFFVSLFYQDVQELSALQASLRFVPGLVVGFCLNVATGLLVHKVPAHYLVIITTFICAGSPLLMALINPKWSYWYAAFWSMVLYPVSADVLFTVSSLVIVDVFPPKTHALAGAVFNTVAQFGTSLGIAIMAVVASNVTRESGNPNKESPAALMEGYRVIFWLAFACMLFSCGIGVVGLRKAGKVGLKRE
ncbi:MAG: hypothetical protein L6R40_005339 [Gallowayella cf. fulva]|nr:MAG: hypothetical protein L6R40_005339 [Xanthomendoza cf. fulva]